MIHVQIAGFSLFFSQCAKQGLQFSLDHVAVGLGTLVPGELGALSAACMWDAACFHPRALRSPDLPES